jgi:hypothetical protein
MIQTRRNGMSNKRRLVDLSHTIEDGTVTLKGFPTPIICDYLSREASRAIYAEGTEFRRCWRGCWNYAWPTAEIAVMGAKGAVEILYRREIGGADDPAAEGLPGALRQPVRRRGARLRGRRDRPAGDARA